MTITEFVRELLNDSDMQEAFAQDPDGAMAKAGLSHLEQALIWSRDRARIGAAIGQDHSCGGPGRPPPPWPTTQLKIDAVELAAGDARTVTLFIAGHWF